MNHPFLAGFAAIVLVIVLPLLAGRALAQMTSANTNAATATLTPQQVEEKLQKGEVTLIDVREEAEFAEGHIKGAVSFPLSQFEPARLADLRQGKPIVFSCHSGRRSGIAFAKAQEAGVADIYNMAGGLVAWQQAGLATTTVSESPIQLCSNCR